MNLIAKPQSIAADNFFIASFGIDGNLEGVGQWEGKNLSPKWAQVCSDLLAAKGPSFEYVWGAPLSHIRTKFTSAQGAAICTFFVNESVASSLMMLAGYNATAEREVAGLFVNSLRAAPLVQQNAGSAEPFAEALSLSQRPLMAVVPFPIETISDQDHSLVRELSLHLACAYFCAAE